MKYAFFLVLLVNIVFFLWEINSLPKYTTRNDAPIESSGGERILLLSEVPAEKTPPAPVTCYRGGLFADGEVAQSWPDGPATPADVSGISSEAARQTIDDLLEKSAGLFSDRFTAPWEQDTKMRVQDRRRENLPVPADSVWPICAGQNAKKSADREKRLTGRQISVP